MTAECYKLKAGTGQTNSTLQPRKWNIANLLEEKLDLNKEKLHANRVRLGTATYRLRILDVCQKLPVDDRKGSLCELAFMFSAGFGDGHPP